MPIVRFTNRLSEVPANAANVRGWDYGNSRHDDGSFGPHVYWTYDTYVGFCLKEYERNGYHDSDFYMIIWNPETEAPETICFATTRGWSYPSYNSRVDATPEVVLAWEVWKKATERRNRICRNWERRAKQIAFARAIGETNYRNIRKLEAVVPPDRWAAVADLLTNPRIRSQFKKSLRQQILDWYFNPSPKFQTPLSRKQWSWV